MRLFKCQSCGQLLYFENRTCEKCGHRLGYLPDDNRIHAVEPEGESWRALGAPGSLYRFCANAAHDSCNWLVAAGSSDEFCIACRHNRTVPDFSQSENMEAWRRLELAKHRLFYSLIKLRLPLASRKEDPEFGLAFDFLADPPDGKAMTGHSNGLITLALKEADDAEREERRTQMKEPYRTLLGHFRHEIGHYFWDRLVRGENRLASFRAMFGDERQDYSAALERFYASAPPPDWQNSFVSAYATSHPWEDFAETWSHYLHIVDTLETAGAFCIHIAPLLDDSGALEARVDFDPYRAANVRQLIDTWLPVAFAVNDINRSMGQSDAYPFILSAKAIEKLGFVHQLVRAQRLPLLKAEPAPIVSAA